MSTPLPKFLHLSAHNLAIVCIAISGAIHLLIVPVQLSHTLVHGGFFAFLGVAQLFWALYFRWRPSTLLYWAGVGLSGGIVTTWVLAFFLSTPFSTHVEPIDAALIASKILEFIGLLALITYGAARRVPTTTGLSPHRLVASSLVASVILGAAVWGGGELAELIVPGSGAVSALESGRSHSDGHSIEHDDSEPHHTEPATGKPSTDSPILPGSQSFARAEVGAIPVDSTMGTPSAATDGVLTNDFSAAESGLTLDPARANPPGLPSDIQAMIEEAVEAGLGPDPTLPPSPSLPSDVQAMIALAVEAALNPDSTPVPSPDLPSDFQAMIAVAVEAALNPDPALIATSGQLPEDPSPIAAPMGAGPEDHEFAHLHNDESDESIARPAEESVPKPLAVRREPATTFTPPQTNVLSAAPEPIASPSARTGLIDSFWPGERPSDLRLVLLAGALVALILIAMIGAVRSWNDIA